MIKIHYIDEHLLVTEKPAGLLTVPGKGEDKQDCLINRIKADHPTALTVHRLDMATSGLVVIALSKQAHRMMNAVFANRQVKKSYVAIVDGIIKQEQGEVNLPLICDWPHRPKQKIDHKVGKPSLTLYQRHSVDQSANTSRVILTPITGRSHQLRVHMLSIGHVILGDNLYASKHIAAKSARLLLHATALSFDHPISKKSINLFVSAPF